MRKAITKILAYIFLIFGIIIVVSLLLSIAAIFIYIPNGVGSKQFITSGALGLSAFIIGFISVALFEFFMEAGDKLSQSSSPPTDNTVPAMPQQKLYDLKKVVKDRK